MSVSSQVRQRDSAVQRLKDGIPWYAKIAAKILLARLPVPYDLWRRTSLFRHGAMDVPERALQTVRGILADAGLCHAEAAAAAQAGMPPRLQGLSILELGPGDSLATALIARALGARQAILVDDGDFASRDMTGYRALAALLEREGADLAAAKSAPDAAALLETAGGRYLTKGLASLEGLLPGSVDFAFSTAVLEHIRAHEFRPMMRALRRALAPSGRSFHDVDLQDHLAYALNNLRFPDRIWESAFMARSGFYTNRIGHAEMLSIFREAGFSVEVLSVRRFAGLPTPRAGMAARFRSRSDEDLMVSGFSVLLRPA